MAPRLKHMNSVLFTVTERLMLSAVCSKDLSWADVVAGNARSSVIVSVGYRMIFMSSHFLLLDLFMLEECSLDRLINKYDANVSPCRTRATMSKKSMSELWERTFAYVFL